jgi:hypothetical protein
MTALRVASRILGLLSACALLAFGTLAAAGVPFAPRLGWVAWLCFYVAVLEGR